jgi:hypothetical protein
MEEFITEFHDIFATKNDDCGRTDRVSHRIDTGDAHPFRLIGFMANSHNWPAHFGNKLNSPISWLGSTSSFTIGV